MKKVPILEDEGTGIQTMPSEAKLPRMVCVYFLDVRLPQIDIWHNLASMVALLAQHFRVQSLILSNIVYIIYPNCS